MNRTAFAAAALLATLALAGCAPSATPITAPSTLGSEPSPTPSQVPENGKTAPAPVFAGDCGAVLTEAQLTDIFGVSGTVSRSPGGTGEPDESMVDQLGGVVCQWDATDIAGDYHFMLHGSVIPASLIAASAVDLLDCVIGPETFCEYATTTGNLTFSGSLYLKEGSDRATLDNDIQAITGAFASSAETQTNYLPPIQSESAWSLDFECSSVQSLVLEGVGSPDLPVLEGGYNAYPTPAERTLWGSRDTLACGWLGKHTHPGVRYLSFSFLGGAAWAVDRSGTPYEIEGVDFASSSVDGFQTIEVVDGVNWLQVYVTPGHDTEVKAMIVDLLAVLNG